MPQIVTIKADGTEDYTTVAAWVASPDYSTDWGIGNPATALIDGVVTGATTINTTITPNGALIKAAAGQEYDGTNSATCATLTSSGQTLFLRDTGVNVQDIFVESTGNTSLYVGLNQAIDSDITRVGVRATALAGFAVAVQYGTGTYSGNTQYLVVEESGTIGLRARGLATNPFRNLTILETCKRNNAGDEGILSDNASNVFIDCVSKRAAGVSGTDWSGSYDTVNSTNNASGDATVPGVNTVTGVVDADFVNIASLDFRTAIGGALETSGSGGSYIGAFLEVSGGITVTENTNNTNYTSNDPVITLTGSISISETLVNSNYTSLNPTISLTGVVSITEAISNVNYTSLNPVIDFTGLVSVVESLENTNYNSLNPLITLTSATIKITEQIAGAQYQARPPSILLTPPPLAIVSTVCFDGVIQDLSYNGNLQDLAYNGAINFVEFNGDMKELEFNGTIQTSCCDGSIKTDC